MESGEVITRESPRQIYDDACELMLAGREPVTKFEQLLIVNYWSVNIVSQKTSLIIRKLCDLFDFKVEDYEIETIVQFHKDGDHLVS